MSMIFTKVQFDNSSAPSEINGESLTYELNGKKFIRTEDADIELRAENSEDEFF